MIKKKMWFWAENVLETLGLSMAAALVMFVIAGGSFYSTKENVFPVLLSLFPFYLILAGILMTMMLIFGYTLVYYPVLVSMNVKRRTVSIGAAGMCASSICVLLLISALIWKLVPGKIADAGWRLLPFFAGIMSGCVGLMLMFAGVSLRWGKVGRVVFAICGAFCGAAIGFSVAVTGLGGIDMETVGSMAGKIGVIGNYVLAGGIVLFLAGSVAIWKLTDRIEVRA